MAADTPDLAVHPTTPERWDDLEALFGENGACEGCWCQYWRRPAAEYEAGKGATNRRRLRETGASGDPPGLLADEDDAPVGWCAVGPAAPSSASRPPASSRRSTTRRSGRSRVSTWPPRPATEA